MALTFGQMANRILAETYRDASFMTAVKNAIVSAIKELEANQLFINTAFAQLTINQGEDSAALPNDFVSMLQVQLLYNVNGQPGEVILSSSSGFRELTFWELKAYQPISYNVVGSPAGWALWGDRIYLTPKAYANFFLNLYYYRRDGSYPVADSDTSIWLGDFTEDVTRYTARGIFYRDVLQSPELAASDFLKAEDALKKLYVRNSQRETINTLSM